MTGTSNLQTFKYVQKIIRIFINSKGAIRPHLLLSGPTGSGKTYAIKTLADKLGVQSLCFIAAVVTKEGVSGSSLATILTPLLHLKDHLTIIHVDEFDKAVASLDSAGAQLGVQAEFLKMLEDKTTKVYKGYGEYIDARVDNKLFIFSGAFSGLEEVNNESLLKIGIMPEFLGRVNIHYALTQLTEEELHTIVDKSQMLIDYSELFKQDVEEVRKTIKEAVSAVHEKNLFGARLVNLILNQYFIEGRIDTSVFKLDAVSLGLPETEIELIDEEIAL